MSSNQASVLRLALLGGGTVGSNVARLLSQSAADLQARSGSSLELVGVGVRDTSREREGVPSELLTTDLAGLVTRDDVDIVVELIGGIEPARELILQAFAHGKSVVSANKALIATHGAELHAAAAANDVDLYYEAAVAGAIPLLRPLRDSLAGDKVSRVLGIVNGTTNFMLSKMTEEGWTYQEAFDVANELGYLEADPSADVDGLDAAAKAAILAGMAFHTDVTLDDVFCEGISKVTAADIAAADRMGAVVKLLAIAELTEDGTGVIVRVHPTQVPKTHPLASVRDAFNAVFIESESAGQTMFYGVGAGGAPTASAVLGDIVTVAQHRKAQHTGPGAVTYTNRKVHPVGDATTRYYINLDVVDESGVLAQIAQIFAEHDVSLETVRQDGHGPNAQLIVRTHAAKEAALADTLAKLEQSPLVHHILGVMRYEVEG